MTGRIRIDARQPASAGVVHNWGALIALIAAMLICGAFNPPIRPLVVPV